jgi:hypothetical protein
MILDKLHKNIIAGFGETIWPLYTIFKDRLELRKFEDLKMIHGTHAEFKATVRSDIEKNGLLCPIVIDLKNEIRNGNHRFKSIRKHGDASFFYVAKTDQEVNFFSRLNVLCWELHPDMKQLMDKLWQGKMKKYTEKVPHLFTENVRSVNLKQ